MVSRARVARRASTFLLVAAGVAHVLVGATFLLFDTNLLGPVFERANDIPSEVWGGWALLSGAAVFPHRTRVAGLLATGCWYTLWGAVLIVGVIDNGGPYYAVPVYLLMIVLHFVFAVFEWSQQTERPQ
jgi:hypothetical protein